jgi:hypothetical protein
LSPHLRLSVSTFSDCHMIYINATLSIINDTPFIIG